MEKYIKKTKNEWVECGFQNIWNTSLKMVSFIYKTKLHEQQISLDFTNFYIEHVNLPRTIRKVPRGLWESCNVYMI